MGRTVARRIGRVAFLCLLVTGRLTLGFSGVAVARTSAHVDGTKSSVVPKGWKTYQYQLMLISIPANWYVMVDTVACAPANRPGVLMIDPTPGFCANVAGPKNVVAVTPSSRWTANASNSVRVNGILADIPDSSGGLSLTTEWIVPGLELYAHGPLAQRSLHTIRPA